MTLVPLGQLVHVLGLVVMEKRLLANINMLVSPGISSLVDDPDVLNIVSHTISTLVESGHIARDARLFGRSLGFLAPHRG